MATVVICTQQFYNYAIYFCFITVVKTMDKDYAEQTNCCFLCVGIGDEVLFLNHHMSRGTLSSLLV